MTLWLPPRSHKPQYLPYSTLCKQWYSRPNPSLLNPSLPVRLIQCFFFFFSSFFLNICLPNQRGKERGMGKCLYSLKKGSGGYGKCWHWMTKGMGGGLHLHTFSWRNLWRVLFGDFCSNWFKLVSANPPNSQTNCCYAFQDWWVDN